MVIHLHQRHPLLLPEKIHDQIVGNTAKPGKEALLVAVSTEIVQGFYPSPLEKVVNLAFVIGQELVQVGIELQPITGIERVERGVVTLLTTPNQRYIRYCQAGFHQFLCREAIAH